MISKAVKSWIVMLTILCLNACSGPYYGYADRLVRGDMPEDFDLCLYALDDFTRLEYGQRLDFRVWVLPEGEKVLARGREVPENLVKINHSLWQAFTGGEWTVITMHHNACELTAHAVIRHLSIIEIEGDSWGDRFHERTDKEADQTRFIKHFREENQ